LEVRPRPQTSSPGKRGCANVERTALIHLPKERTGRRGMSLRLKGDSAVDDAAQPEYVAAPSALLGRGPICTLPFRSALAAGRGTRDVKGAGVGRRAVLSRRADLVGYGSSPGWEVSLAGMRHDLRISI
jgi:hypothetical protein